MTSPSVSILHDGTEHGTRGFTDFGIETVREVLDDPPQLKYLLQGQP